MDFIAILIVYIIIVIITRGGVGDMAQQIDEFRYQLDNLQGVWDDGHSTAEQTLFLIADVMITYAETLGGILAILKRGERVKRLGGG